MMRGELVHIPQGAILLAAGDLDGDDYLALDRPRHALFWEDAEDYYRWCRIFYKGQMWMVKRKSVYPITTQE